MCERTRPNERTTKRPQHRFPVRLTRTRLRVGTRALLARDGSVRNAVAAWALPRLCANLGRTMPGIDRAMLTQLMVRRRVIVS